MSRLFSGEKYDDQCSSVAEGQVSIDQAALTGESLPVNKSVGDEIYSGSTCKQGEAEAIGLLSNEPKRTE